MKTIKAFHGGSFFKFLGEDFSTLERKEQMINADVLDAWFDPCPSAIEKIHKELPFLLRTSPPTHADGLIDTIAAVRGINRDMIAVAGGSSDLLFYLFPHAGLEGKKVMILDPMYGEYRHIFNEVINTELLHFNLLPEMDFNMDTNGLLKAVNENKPDWLIMVNPNSPTGKYLNRDELINLLQSLPASVRVLVDETYIEYVGSAYSVEPFIQEFPQLMVIKSMSKVYALSGARVAYLAGTKERIREINGYIPPWSVSLPAQIAAIEALKHPDYYETQYIKTHQMREQMIAELRKVSCIKVIDSVANFFLLQLLHTNQTASAICSMLEKENIFIRNCDSMSTQFRDKYIRIAVKSEEQNRKLLNRLNAYFAG